MGRSRANLSLVPGSGPSPARGLAPVAEALEPRCLLAAEPFAEGHTIVEMQTNYGSIMIELFDDIVPVTVTNFLNYVTTNHYDDTFFHRLASGVVLQGGHFFMDEDQRVRERTTHAPILNEFEISNTVRTVAMAKLPGDPNSASDQFFFNLGNNSGQFDGQNGGFTVFGQVVNGWETVLTIARLPVTTVLTPFTELPVRRGFEDATVGPEDLVVINDVNVITSPGWSQRAVVGGVVNGVGAANSASLFVTSNTLGRPIALYQPEGSSSWFVSDIGLESGAPTTSGAPVAWFDPKDSTFYAAAPSAQGLLLFRRNADGFWDMRNLTTEIDFAANIVSEITVFQDVNDGAYLAGLTNVGASPQLIVYFQSGGASANGDFFWGYANLQDQLAQQGQTTPAFEDELVSYVTPWNGLNIAGLDAEGDIHTVWWAPGETLWHTDNLSDLTGAPVYTGPLSTFVSFWGSINLVGTDATGDVITTWWAPDTTWHTSNLTDTFNGPQLERRSISSYVTPWGALNVAGINQAGHIVIYWWAPDTQTWTVSPITEQISGVTLPEGRLMGVSSDAGPINLTGTAANGDILRYFWTPSTDTWAMQNLTVVGRWL